MKSSDYHTLREQLILEDRAQRVDAEKLQNPYHVEKQADQVVRTIRAIEATSVWGADTKSIFEYAPGNTSPNVFPGMAFLTGTSRLQTNMDLEMMLMFSMQSS